MTAGGKVLDSLDDEPTAGGGGSGPPASSEFNQAATEVMSVPAAVANAARSSIEASESTGFESSSFEDGNTTQMSTAEVQERLAEARRLSEESEPMDEASAGSAPSGPVLPPGPPGGGDVDDADTAVMKADELQVMVGKEPSLSDSPFLDANDEATTRHSANPHLAASRPTEEANDLPDGSLIYTDPEVDSGVDLGAVDMGSTDMSDDMGRPVLLDDERPRMRGAQGLSGGGDAAVSLPQFPSVALREYFSGLVQFASAQTPPVKIIMISAALAAAILFVVILFAFSSDESYQIFAEENQSLMAGPGPNAIYAKVTDIQRGDELIAFAGGEMGEYLLVRDVMGQAGYVQRSSVSEHRPISLPGIPFAGCRQSPLELDVSPCRLRTQTQFESCRTVCDGEIDPETCLDHCQKQLVACISGCEGESVEIAEVPVANPTLDEPIEEDAPAAYEESSTRPVAKRKPKGKKKRRKKKKRR